MATRLERRTYSIALSLAPARAPPDAEGPWTREPCDNVDPMPDYENVLTD